MQFLHNLPWVKHLHHTITLLCFYGYYIMTDFNKKKFHGWFWELCMVTLRFTCISQLLCSSKNLPYPALVPFRLFGNTNICDGNPTAVLKENL